MTDTEGKVGPQLDQAQRCWREIPLEMLAGGKNRLILKRGGATSQVSRLINQGFPAVALFPKKQTNKINKKPARPVHSGGQENDPDPTLGGKAPGENPSKYHFSTTGGFRLTDFFPTSAGEGKGGQFLGEPAQLLGGLPLLAGLYGHLCQPSQTGRSSLPSPPTPAPHPPQTLARARSSQEEESGRGFHFLWGC